MSYYPLNAEHAYDVSNILIWTKQGTSFVISGSFTTLPNLPSKQLQASTNTTRGYSNGQMLAFSSGTVSGGGSSGQVARALINWDPDSTDTGQQVWNGFIICDPGLKITLPLLDPDTGDDFVYPGTIQVATPLQGWVIRQQFLYGAGTPATDATAVNTAVQNSTTAATGFKCIQSIIQNASNGDEIIFAY